MLKNRREMSSISLFAYVCHQCVLLHIAARVLGHPSSHHSHSRRDGKYSDGSFGCSEWNRNGEATNAFAADFKRPLRV